jgi:uncharacterized protein (DUF305 family)
MRSTATRAAAALAALAAAAVLGSCGGPSASHQHAEHTGAGPTHTAPANHNAADAAFAQNMIPHHQQAVDMSAMVPTRTVSEDMLVIAKDISRDQQAEIWGLQGLLREWGEPVAPDNGGHADHGGMAMQGMVDPATLDQLKSLEGAEFDTLWMRSMISHHQGAITMAQEEIAHGESHDAIEMAKRIINAQQREIAYMTHLLSTAE